MRRHLLLLLLACNPACNGARQPPLVGGDGVTVDNDEDRRVVALDTARVPVVDGCTAGQVLTRTDGKWACADSPALTLESRIRALEDGVAGRVEAAQRKLGELESSLAAVRSERLALSAEIDATAAALDARIAEDSAAPASLGAAGCVPSPASFALAEIDASTSRVAHAAGATGAIELYCPVVPSSPSVAWNRLTLLYADPDGPGAAARVRVSLHSIDASGMSTQLAEADSNSAASPAAPGEVTTAIAPAHSFDFAARYYYLRVVIERASPAVSPDARGVRLWRG